MGKDAAEINTLAMLVGRLAFELEYEGLHARDNLVSLVGVCLHLLEVRADLREEAPRQLLLDALEPARDYLEVRNPELGTMAAGETGEEGEYEEGDPGAE